MAADIDRSQVQQHWVHSHEEDEPGHLVYRKSTYEFPPSRGRASLDLRDEGDADVGGPAPDDRPATTKGHWHLEGNALTVTTADNQRRYLIEQLTDDRLVLNQD